MRRRNLYLGLLAFAFTGLLSFLVGFVYSVVDSVAADPQSSPYRVSDSPDAASIIKNDEPAGSGVKPLEMFWESYTLVRQRFRLSGTSDFKDEKLLYAGLDGMLRSLGDPYTRFLDPTAYKQMVEQNTGQFQGIGAYLKTAKDRKHIILAPISDGPASKAGLKRNDVLLKINDTNAVGMDIEKAKNLIRGDMGTTVKLTIGRLADASKPEGSANPMKQLQISVVRDVIKPDEVQFKAGPPSGHEKETDIGYVLLQQFSEDSENQIDHALTELTKRKVKGIVLDLRDNPGGLLDVAVGIASRFIEDGPIVFIQEAGGNRRALKAETRKYSRLNRPVVVLVNRFSASASEILSGAMHDKGVAKLVGETTFGKGLVQTIIPLDNDGSAGALKITTAKYFTPNGTDINRKGIKPDYEVAAGEGAGNHDPFAEGSKNAQDPQLNRAIAVLREQIAGGGAVARSTR